MAAEIVQSAFDRVGTLLVSPGSALSLWSLVAAGLLAAAVALVQRKGRALSLRAVLRAVMPRGLFGASGRADIGFMLMAVFVSAALFGWAIASHLVIADAVADTLGRPLALGLPVWLAVGATTLMLWLAYEFAYFLDHYLCHKIPALWAFHKVHHSAESLSPLTVFRVHPVDSIVFYNIVAVMTGVTAGAMRWLVGEGVSPWTIGGANVLAVAGLMTIKHLHHSHVWIAWGGIWGRIILSPAHHQIHHSVARAHHDRNFGDVLGVFDWMAGTLHVPQATREVLTFGVEGPDRPHSAYGALVVPFVDALTPSASAVPASVRNTIAA